jgi:hypothetical protein
MQSFGLSNLATVYSTEEQNYDFNQVGSNTHSSTSTGDVQTSSTSTSTTTYTPSPLEQWLAGLKKDKKPLFGLQNLEMIDPCLMASEGKKDFIWEACERDMAAGTWTMQNLQSG